MFVDCDKTGNIDYNKIEDKITSSTKAIIITHMWGYPCKKGGKKMECHFCSNACIVDKDKKKILFIHHKKMNKWLLVGGHIEKDENPEEAVIREVKEETDLSITLLGKRYPREEDFIIPFAIPKNIINENHIHIDIFYVVLVNDILQLKENEEEILGAKWFSRQEILSSNFNTFLDKKSIKIRCN